MNAHYRAALDNVPPLATYGNRSDTWIREQFALAGADVAIIEHGDGGRMRITALIERDDCDWQFMLRLNDVAPGLRVEARSSYDDMHTRRTGVRMVCGFVGGEF